MCCSKDKWNVIKNSDGTSSKVDNFGLNLATKRAHIWGEEGREVLLPDSIIDEVQKFVARCKRYYKNRNAPEWLTEALDGLPPESQIPVEITQNELAAETVEKKASNLPEKGAV